VVTISIVMASRTYGWQPTGYVFAAMYAMVSMLVIGRLFDTELANLLRVMAASMFLAGCGYAVYRFVLRDERLLSIASLAVGSVTALLYAWMVRRKGWFTVSAIQMLVLAGLMSYDGVNTGKLRRVNWPISGGMACFVVGVVITTSKTSQFAQARERRRLENSGAASGYLPGLSPQACLLASPVWQVFASGHNAVSSIAYSMTSAGCDDDHHTRLEGRTRSTS
jgi:hypothetical protein